MLADGLTKTLPQHFLKGIEGNEGWLSKGDI